MSNIKTTLPSGIVAVYCSNEKRLRLPIVGLNDADRPLVLTAAGKIVEATKHRALVGSCRYSFGQIEARS